MNTRTKAFQACLLFCALSLLLSRTASAFTGQGMIDVSTVIPHLEQSGTRYPAFRSLGRFEEQLNGTLPTQAKPDVPWDAGERQVPSLRTYGKDFSPDLMYGTGRIFSRDNLPLALIGLGITGLAITADRKVKNYAQDRRPLDSGSKIGDKLGKETVHIGIGAALLGAGELTNSPKLADTGVVVLESLFVNFIATEGLNYSFRRRSPDGSNRTSFPSGHVSSTAALAASISEMFDWNPKAAIPLYATAAFVGASRIQDNKQYLSSVLAGMTLGTIIGASFAKYHKEKNKEQKGRRKISFSPIFEKGLKGGLFTMKW